MPENTKKEGFMLSLLSEQVRAEMLVIDENGEKMDIDLTCNPSGDCHV
jgi:hypothetical protein